MSGGTKHIRAVARVADRYGLDVEWAGASHLRLVDRESRRWVLTAAATPKRPETALKEIERDLRRRARGQY